MYKVYLQIVPNIGILIEKSGMAKNTSITLGEHFVYVIPLDLILKKQI